jgi:biopolymer transport protein ExbD
MNFRSTITNDDTPDINLIPLIDVLLVILIFLAATTTFSRDQQLKVALPQASAEQMIVPTLEIRVTQDGRYGLGGVLVQQGDLVSALRAKMSGQQENILLIRADAMAPHQSVIHVMQAAQEAGLSKVHFATQASQ